MRRWEISSELASKGFDVLLEWSLVWSKSVLECFRECLACRCEWPSTQSSCLKVFSECLECCWIVLKCSVYIGCLRVLECYVVLPGANGRAPEVLANRQLARPPLALPGLVKQPRLGARCSAWARPAGISFISSLFSSSFSSSSSSSPIYQGATGALGGETFFYARTLALAHRCLPC